MSGSYQDAHAGLCDEIEAAVPGLRVIRKPGALGTPPAVYVPPPSLTWDGYVQDPTEAIFEIVLAVAADEKAIERLFRFLGPLCAAIDAAESIDATVKSAEPGVWRTGGTELPCYFVRTEVSI